MKTLFTAVAAVAAFGMLTTDIARADRLDDVISAGVLRCGVVLDFPPIGFLDENNQPAGFDVQYCQDFAAALDVDLELVQLTWAERLPSIVTGRTDVVFGATSDTLERAKTVGFSIPYAIYFAQAVVHVDSGIETFEDMRGMRVGAGLGTVPEQEWLQIAEEWGETNLYSGFQSENEVFLATAQRRVDAGITTNTAVGPITDQFDTLIPGPRMPWTTDYTSVIVPRLEQGWLNYVNLFITHQVRSGRYEELWMRYVGTEAPDLRIPGVHY